MGKADADGGVSYDPRLLAFEYAFNLLLRAQQTDLVNEFVRAAAARESRVHQMIMGAGKTTVIMPLVALGLADGSRLVTVVVPGPLLEMSAAVLRRCFGPIFPKARSRMDQGWGRLTMTLPLTRPRPYRRRSRTWTFRASSAATSSLPSRCTTA